MVLHYHTVSSRWCLLTKDPIDTYNFYFSMKFPPILVMVILYQWYHHNLDGHRVTDASFKTSWWITCWKILKGISVECMKCLKKDVKKKNTDPVHLGGRDEQITTNATKLLDITHESYGFSGVLIENINEWI